MTICKTHATPRQARTACFLGPCLVPTASLFRRFVKKKPEIPVVEKVFSQLTFRKNDCGFCASVRAEANHAVASNVILGLRMELPEKMSVKKIAKLSSHVKRNVPTAGVQAARRGCSKRCAPVWLERDSVLPPPQVQFKRAPQIVALPRRPNWHGICEFLSAHSSNDKEP